VTFPSDLAARAAGVRLFLSDVDGVWTDGRVTVNADGSESVAFHVHDGFGVHRLREAGVVVAVVSGRETPAVAHRCARLGIEEVHLGVRDKGAAAAELMARHGVERDAVAAIGDDLLDLPLLEAAGLRIAPPQAVAEVRRSADWVTRADAGFGAFREACELLLAARGR